MTDDLYKHGDASIECRIDELIRAIEDPILQKKVYQCAYKLTRNKADAQDYSQEAITRFISAVRNKTSFEEIERMRPLPYVYVILRNMHRDKWKKMHSNVHQGNTPHQMDEPQEDASEKRGRQKCELLAAQIGMSIGDIADLQLEEGQGESTRLGVEEHVVSEIIVEAFINSLPEELRELTRLLTFKEYQLNELTGILKLSHEELKLRKERVREALRRFQQEQIQLEKARSTHGR